MSGMGWAEMDNGEDHSSPAERQWHARARNLVAGRGMLAELVGVMGAQARV